MELEFITVGKIVNTHGIRGEVKLLPALPAAFPQGYVRGLRITGRRAVDIRWENGTMTAHRIYTGD